MEKVSYYIALLVSRILDPIVLFFVLFLFVIFFKIGVSSESFLITVGLIFFEVLVCLGYLGFLVFTKKIDYDITDRKKRPLFLVPVGVFLVFI